MSMVPVRLDLCKQATKFNTLSLGVETFIKDFIEIKVWGDLAKIGQNFNLSRDRQHDKSKYCQPWKFDISRFSGKNIM